jgi:elongation factor Ts
MEARSTSSAPRARRRPPSGRPREASEGAIGSYIHMGGKIGVLVEVNCETDFVRERRLPAARARHRDAHRRASPAAVRREDIPEELVERERTSTASR